MYAGKPVIGIVGGIGSGKSFVARLFGEMGCLVIDSDAQVSQAYQDPHIRQSLREWWGDKVFTPAGEINRSGIAGIIFSDAKKKARLEGLLHPWIAKQRQAVMEAHQNDAQVLAFVWDTPLLFETGLDRQCDAVVFVDAPYETRLQRVQQARRWRDGELALREKLQLPLDKKREMSDHVIGNAAGADQVRAQVREVLSRILAAGSTPKTAFP